MKKGQKKYKNTSKSLKKIRDWYYFVLKDFKRSVKLLSPTEKSIIITFFILFFVLFSLVLIRFTERKKEIMVEMSVSPEHWEEEKLNEELLDNQLVRIDKISIQAYNEADKSLTHTDDAFKSLDEILSEMERKSAEEEILKEKESVSEEPTSAGISEKEKSQSAENKNVINKNTLVKYALEHRKTQGDLPNPVFTCEEEGEIVVTIKVNEDGKVIHCSVDSAKSSTSNGCLIENALKYASQARFNVATGRGVQKGTITYLFQRK